MSKVFKAIGGLVSKIMPSAKMPMGLAQAVMPDRDSTASRLASRKKIEARSKGGREGTIYSSGAYGGSNLAGTA